MVMKHSAKDNEHLIAEAAGLRQRASKLEQNEIERERAEELIRFPLAPAAILRFRCGLIKPSPGQKPLDFALFSSSVSTG